MLGLFKSSKKNFSLSTQTKTRIEKGKKYFLILIIKIELEYLNETFEGIYTKTKEFELGTYINVNKKINK